MRNAKFFIGTVAELCLGLKTEAPLRPQTDANLSSR